MHCSFNQLEKREVEVKLDGIVVQNAKKACYLGSVFQENGMESNGCTGEVLPECYVIEGRLPN